VARLGRLTMPARIENTIPILSVRSLSASIDY
jgi:hypothetical protein